ncbi:MAG: hypothetical protein JJ855_04335 [Rhodospirillales bacterium]|nr:hypothetical protein [Rhodospirillales bacterium]
MKNFVCWNRDDALEIINPDVDAQPDAYFRAVHTDVPIRKQDRERSSTSVINAEEVLDQFLDPPKYALVPIIGYSGSGKSHLVRWMNLRIKRDDTREVLFVPKARTNLRDIVIALIGRLPDGSQEKYLNMVQGTGTTSYIVSAQRSLILSNIQAELKNDESYKDDSREDRDELEFLLRGLSSLFIDPYVRDQHFLKDDSFAADLANHIFEKPDGYNPAEKRREFTLQDLPSHIDDLTHSAKATREFLQFLAGQDMRLSEKAVSIVNRHTDAAIARCLNLSGDHLIQIMTEIRENLKKTGKELILLIEDFARLQGLDRALLQSVLEQGNDDLCTLRTAFACTTGFYGSLEATAKTRLSFVIDMDTPLKEGKDKFNLEGMVARYMNAVRLGPEKLRKSWELHKEEDASFSIDSACDECEHRSECHAAFGQVDGSGLYPFTKNAINVMAHRTDQNVDEKFNARTFQTSVLRPVTGLTSELEGGRFPPKSLLNDMGGLRDFPPDEQEKVKKRSPEDADRHLALIALWGGSVRAKDLPHGIQEAFGLKPLNLEGEQGSDVPTIPTQPPGPSGLSPGPSIPEIDALSRWANSDIKLPQQVANELRPLVFDAVVSFINWDELGCPRTFWAGSSGVFKQNGVIFENQTTKARAGSLISLTVPLNWEDDSDRTNTYLALSGLIEAERNRHWRFEGAAKKYVCLQECLRLWSGEIARQISDLKEGPDGWFPASAALELSVLGRLLTSSLEKEPDKLDLLEMGFQEMSPTSGYLSTDLEKIVEQIRSKQADLIKFIREGVTASKGGQSGNFLQSNILVEAMVSFKRRNYKLMDLPSSDGVPLTWHKEILALAKSVSGKLDAALKQEVDVRLKWLADVDAAFGAETDEKRISDAIKSAASAVSKLGIQGTSDLQFKANQFAQCDFSSAVRATREMKKAEAVRPWHVAPNIRGAKEVSADLINNATQVLVRAKSDIEAKLNDVGYDPGAIETLVSQIGADLEEISRALQGGDVAEPH